MDYLCCPFACVIQPIRWLIRRCHAIRGQSNQEERWALLEESYPELSSRSSPLFFRVVPADTPSHKSPVFVL